MRERRLGRMGVKCYKRAIMLPLPACHYIAAGLDNTPLTLAALVSRFPGNDPIWETRPSPDRFSLREIVAHLADWEEIWRGRFEPTVNEEHPLLLRPDPDRRAEEQGYSRAEPVECLARFQERRAALTGWLRSLPEETWARTAHLDRLGDVPLVGLAALALSHDSYHLRQVAEWLSAA